VLPIEAVAKSMTANSSFNPEPTATTTGTVAVGSGLNEEGGNG